MDISGKLTTVVAPVSERADRLQRVAPENPDFPVLTVGDVHESLFGIRRERHVIVADAEAALDDARPAIDELDDEDAAGLRADVEAVESSLAAVESDLQAEAYADANQGARNALSAARDIGSSLTAMAIEEEADSEDAARVRVIPAVLHDRPYTDPGIDDERLVVERNAPRWIRSSAPSRRTRGRRIATFRPPSTT